MKKDVLWLATPFTAVVLLFLAAATVSLMMAQRIDVDVTEIQTNALPSVRLLSQARSKLTHLETDLAGLAAVPPEGRGAAIAEIREVRVTLQADLHAYSQNPWYAGEHELYDEALLPSLTVLDKDLDGVSDEGEWREAASRAVIDVDKVDRAASDLLTMNHEQANAAADRVLAKREDLRLTAIVLNAGALALAAVLGILAIRAARRLRAVTEQNAALQESRAQELEVFADRLAHDILSPLAGVSFLLGSIDREAPEVERLTGRARAALERADPDESPTSDGLEARSAAPLH